MFRENIKVVRVSNAVAAGTTAVNGTAVDMSGYDGVVFYALFGAIVTGAITSLKAQSCTAADGSGAADLAGTSVAVAEGDDNLVAALEIYRPQTQYVRPVISRGTQNATVDGILAVLFNGRVAPATLDATMIAASKTVGSPAAGTA
jgi:hypothetical protein